MTTAETAISSDIFENEESSSDPNRTHRIWDMIAEPAATVDVFENRRMARLLSSLLFTVLLLTTGVVFSRVWLGTTQDGGFVSQVSLAFILLISYGVSRTRFYSRAGFIAVTFLAGAPIATYLGGGDYGYATTIESLIWTVSAVLLAGFIFSSQGVVMLAALLLLAVGGLPLLEPLITVHSLFPVLGILLMTTFIVLVTKRNRELQAAFRQEDLSNANRGLQALATLLEARAADRAQDLALAAEVGEILSQVRNLDTLLNDAAEQILAHGDLYCVQVFLADSSERRLIRRAATLSGPGSRRSEGSEEYLAGDMRMTIGPASISGLAAANRQSVVIPDTLTSPLSRPDSLLPDTRSQMAVPLVIGDRLSGVLDLQSAKPNALTNENLPAYRILASQLAIAIENARLFTQSMQAQADLEASAAKEARGHWQAYLDGIHRSERIGFVYDEADVAPLQDALPEEMDENVLAASISVHGEEIGAIQLRPEEGHIWTATEAELLSSVARQVAQRVENLRYLAQAEQYRAEAEEAARRLLHESWDAYLESDRFATRSYVYDQSEVMPYEGEESDSFDSAGLLVQPLKVGEETIGYVDVMESREDNEETGELLESVAARLSAHIENLRLSQQTGMALAATEQHAHRLALLNQMSEALGRAPTSEDILEVAVGHIGRILASDRASLTILAPSGDSVELLAVHGEKGDIPVGTEIPLEESPSIAQAVRENRVVMTQDVPSKELGGMRSRMVAPLSGDGQVIGTINVGSAKPYAYSSADENLIVQITAILGSTIVRRHLAERAQSRANQERILRKITAQVHAAVDAESILRTAAREVNRALGMDTFIYLGDLEKGSDSNE